MAWNKRKGMKAQKAQRRRRPLKKKPAYKHGKKTAPKLYSTREVKHIETVVETKHVVHSAIGSTTMPNGILFYPAGFNSVTNHIPQGVGCHALVGCFMRPLYCSQKFTIDFQSLDWTKQQVNSGLRLRCRSGWIRNTGKKYNAALTSATDWVNDIQKMTHETLQAADMDADYLQYVQKSRNIMMVKDSFLKPRLDQRMGYGDHVDSHATTAPRINFTINWDQTRGWLRNKTRLEPMQDDNTKLVLHNQFVPFVYFSCENLSAVSDGHIVIKSSSRYYYTDA